MDHNKLKLTRVSRKGQVTIPEEMRKAFGINEGDFMLVVGVKGLVMLKKLTLPAWEELLQQGERFAEKAHITREEILRAVRERQGAGVDYDPAGHERGHG
jgi:AbrB family looped-hinge helix DNA binding protein